MDMCRCQKHRHVQPFPSAHQGVEFNHKGPQLVPLFLFFQIHFPEQGVDMMFFKDPSLLFKIPDISQHLSSHGPGPSPSRWFRTAQRAARGQSHGSLAAGLADDVQLGQQNREQRFWTGWIILLYIIHYTDIVIHHYTVYGKL